MCYVYLDITPLRNPKCDTFGCSLHLRVAEVEIFLKFRSKLLVGAYREVRNVLFLQCVIFNHLPLIKLNRFHKGLDTFGVSNEIRNGIHLFLIPDSKCLYTAKL